MLSVVLMTSLMLQAIVDACTAPLQPLPSARPVHWVFNELGSLPFSDLRKASTRVKLQLVSKRKTAVQVHREH